MEGTDFILFDKFRHMERMLRMGRPPGELVRDPCSCNVHHRDIILGVLNISGGSLRPKEIAREFRVSPSTLSEMIRRLEKDGYIIRTPDPEDGRSCVLSLTEAGRSRAEIMKEAHGQMLAHLFRNMTEDDKLEMIRLFDLILQNSAESCGK